MKKISYLFLVMLLVITGLINVNADEYASYRKGDKITVSVNETTKYDFYVIEDSDSSKENVYALYADVLENPYEYTAAVEYMETLEEEWSNTTSVSLPALADIFGSGKEYDEGFNFDDPTWALSELTYWTSDEVAKDDENFVWTVGTTLEGKGKAGTFAATTSQYVKPLINVPKSSVSIAKDKPVVGDETKVNSPETGDMDFLLFGGAIALFFGLAVVSFKKTRTN